jgi:uncharacterized protein YkwD
MRRLAWLVVGVMLALGSVAAAWVGPGAAVAAQSGYSPDAEELAFVDLLNAYRGSLGLGAVTLNYELGAAADYHSADMAANNYFDHYLFDGTDPGTNIQNFGYFGYPWGENIAAGMGTAQEVLIAWQNSPEHNATMTNPNFTEVGIGRQYGEGSYYGWYWTATYGGGEAPESAPEPLPAPVVAPGTTDATLQAQAPETVTTVDEAPSVVTNDGGAVELEQAAINADGDRAVSTGGNPVADGEGEAVYVGDINTGGVMGETIVYEEPSLNVTGGTAPAPAPVTTSEPPPLTTTAPPPAAAVPVVTDPTLTETTVTDIQTNDGTEGAYG